MDNQKLYMCVSDSVKLQDVGMERLIRRMDPFQCGNMRPFEARSEFARTYKQNQRDEDVSTEGLRGPDRHSLYRITTGGIFLPALAFNF